MVAIQHTLSNTKSGLVVKLGQVARPFTLVMRKGTRRGPASLKPTKTITRSETQLKNRPDIFRKKIMGEWNC